MSVETVVYRFSPSHFKLLTFFAGQEGRPVSLAKMAQAAGLSAQALKNELKLMLRDGYRFETSADGKMRLAREPDRLFPERLLRGLETTRLGKTLHAFQKIGSTNDRALLWGEKGTEDGTVLVAENQTRGRGRQGRSWISSEGKGLAFSVLLRPALSFQEASELTLAAAVAVALALEKWKLKPRIKWPNDVYLGGRKVCGILTETRGKQDKIAFAVLGIGVNLNQGPGDFSKDLRSVATSYYRHTGKKIDRVAFFQSLLFQLEKVEGWVRKRQFQRVLSEWRKRSLLNQRQVRIHQPGRVLYAQVVGVDEQGSLLVRNDFGMVEKILAGDVELLRLSKRKVQKRPLKTGDK
jgi:BirA family biotin operon repressor/biotin-[acetyl-CoA-carboxylase] ligase